MFDTAGRKTASTLCSDERYWDLMCVRAQKVTSHQYVVLNGRRTVNAISAIVGISSSYLEFSQELFGNCSVTFKSLEGSANSS